MKASIIFYKMENMTPSKKEKVLRGLFGKEQQSYYGKYKYRLGGVLEEIPNIKPTRGAVIIPEDYEKQIIEFLENHKVEYQIYRTSVRKRTLQPYSYY